MELWDDFWQDMKVLMKTIIGRELAKQQGRAVDSTVLRPPTIVTPCFTLRPFYPRSII
jgi:hypothetical protein